MQKYKKYDYVRIAKDLGDSMSHFTSDKNAIVLGSYSDKYGGENTKSYSLWIEGEGETSWYYEHQIELIEENRPDILNQWESEQSKKKDIESSLDWIFENGNEVLKRPSGYSLIALGKVMGIEDMCGGNGEGINFYLNSVAIMAMAEPFLVAGDKEGFISKHGGEK